MGKTKYLANKQIHTACHRKYGIKMKRTHLLCGPERSVHQSVLSAHFFLLLRHRSLHQLNDLFSGRNESLLHKSSQCLDFRHVC